MLIDFLPTKLVLYLATPYLAGKDEREALVTARSIWQQNKFSATLDILGEESASAEQCQIYIQTYKNLIDMVNANPFPIATVSPISLINKRRQTTISFKPSMFCVVPSPGVLPNRKALDAAFERITVVVDYAYKKNVRLTLEAEDHNWTDFHLDTYIALLNSGYNNLGTVLQTRLFRTEQDVKRFDQRASVRLVIGIYKESAQIAYTDKELMKQALISCSRELLNRGAYVELATHDQNYIRKFFSEAVLLLRATADQFETQFLLGVPRLKLQQALATGEYFKHWQGNGDIGDDRTHWETLARTGTIVRLYLPFGSDEMASPYCKRRLKNNPNLFVYGLKNLFNI